MLATFYSQFLSNSIPELIAVVLAIAYLLLVVRENSLCWYAAFASTFIYLVIFWDVQLYMESLLQVYYLAMAVFGWWQWRQPTTDTPDLAGLAISSWTWQRHTWVVGGIIAAALLTGELLARYTDARLPFLDAFTTWASIVTTYMVTQKILENWIYWFVIDSVSIYLYLDRELYFTAMLFAVYLVIIIFGWAAWQHRYRTQTA